MVILLNKTYIEIVKTRIIKFKEKKRGRELIGKWSVHKGKQCYRFHCIYIKQNKYVLSITLVSILTLDVTTCAIALIANIFASTEFILIRGI